MSSQQEEQHPNRKSRTQQKDLPRKEDSLRKCFPNRKTDTQTANQQPNSNVWKTHIQTAKQKLNRNTCAGEKTYYENAFPTGSVAPKQQITNPTGRLAPERRLIKKMSSEQEGWHPNSKSQAKQEDSPQKEDSLRKCLPSMETDTQTTNRRTHRKTCP